MATETLCEGIGCGRGVEKKFDEAVQSIDGRLVDLVRLTVVEEREDDDGR